MSVIGAKPSVNEEVIRYQARTKLAELATEIANARKLNSSETLFKIKKAKQIRLWLKALDAKAYLTRLQRERIWYALILIAGVNDFPTAPLLEERTQPNILIGGGTTTNNTIIQSESAGNISFVNSDVDTGTEVVDSFPISLSSGAKWKYTARKNDGSAQKSGEIIGTWLADGSDVDWAEAPITSDVGVSPSDVTIAVAYNSGDIELRVTVSTDNWTIEGSREHIPPINATEVNVNLPDAQIYVGNAIGMATARTVSGDITISNIGVVEINTGVIVDADINATAAISQTKIANLTTDLSTKLPLAGGTMSGTIVMGSNQITGLADGVASGDAINKGQLDLHTVRTDNPHSVTKTQIGLSDVDNTSDVNKPVSTAQQAALNLKADITATSWTTLALLNSWVAGSVAPAYMKDGLGIVHLRGSATHTGASSAAVAILSTGFKPSTDFRVPWAGYNGTTLAVISIASYGGQIQGASITEIFLDGISFSTI